MKNRTIVVTLSLLAAMLMSCGPGVKESTVAYAPQPWPARVWASEVPPDCPFERLEGHRGRGLHPQHDRLYRRRHVVSVLGPGRGHVQRLD